MNKVRNFINPSYRFLDVDQAKIDFENKNLIVLEQAWYGKNLNFIEIKTWCEEFCKENVFFSEVLSSIQPGFSRKLFYILWGFKNEKDAMLFKLRWL